MVNNSAARVASEVATPAVGATWLATVPTDIEYAIKSGDLTAVSRHLESGGDVNARTIYQSQMLHVATRHEQAAIVCLLLDHPSVDVNALDYVSV